MAKKAKSKKKAKSTELVRHDWKALMDGKKHTIVQGKHFDSQVHSMYNQLRRNARKLKMRITIKHVGEDTLVFQAFKGKTTPAL